MLLPPGRARLRGEAPIWLPSARSLLLALVAVAVVAGAYVAARETSVFAVRSIEVEGAPPGMASRIRTVLEPLTQTNLVTFDSTDGQRLLATIPTVASAHFDRAFPNTLRVVVVPERPAAVLRRGRDAWVASANARVLRRVTAGQLPPLPRVWLAASEEPIVGAVVPGTTAEAVRAVGPLTQAHLPTAIRSVKVAGGEVSMKLSSGVEVLLVEPFELRLKLAVASRVLRLAGNARLVDVSVPERVVVRDAVP